MNREEFFQWLEFHDAAFPGYQAWFAETVSEGGYETRVQLWLSRLSQFSLRQVQGVSQSMFAAADRPKYHSDHLDWICQKLRPRPLLNDSGPVPFLQKCRLCEDFGLVTVIFREQRFTPAGQPLPGNSGAVACKCSTGQWINDRRNGCKFDTYDSHRMDLPQRRVLSDRERQELLERLGQRNGRLGQALKKITREST